MKTGTILKDLDGNNLKDAYKDKQGKKQERDLTIGLAISGALCMSVADPSKLTPAIVSDMYGLAMKLRGEKEITLKSEQIVMCKDAIVKAYQPLISGQVCVLLEEGE